MRYPLQVLGGERVDVPMDPYQTEIPGRILEKDGEDAVWYFTNFYYALHPKLRGRQVFIGHGMNFPPFLNPRKAETINRYMDRMFEPGRAQDRDRERYGIDPSKVREVGCFTPLQVPPLPVRPNAVLFSTTYYNHWNHDGTMRDILERLDPAIEGYLTIHPRMPERMRRPYLRLVEARKNLRLVRSQDELLEAYSICAMNVNGGSSSVCVPFWFFGKPVVLVRGPLVWSRHGRSAMNPFPGFGWGRIRHEVGEPLFARVLEESVKISHWSQFRWDRLRATPPAPSAKGIFYPWNFDRAETERRLRQCVDELMVK